MENLKKSIGDQIDAAKRDAVEQIWSGTDYSFGASLRIDDGAALHNAINSMDIDDIEIFVELLVDAGQAINYSGDGIGHIVNPELLIDLARGSAANASTPQEYSQSLQNAASSGILPGYNVETGENIILGDHGRHVEGPENSISAVMREAFKAAEMGVVMEPHELKYWQDTAVRNWGSEYANITTASEVPMTFAETAPIKADIAAIDQAVRGQVGLAESYGGIQESSLPTEEEASYRVSSNAVDNSDWDDINPTDAPGPAHRATVLTTDEDIS